MRSTLATRLLLALTTTTLLTGLGAAAALQPDSAAAPAAAVRPAPGPPLRVLPTPVEVAPEAAPAPDTVVAAPASAPRADATAAPVRAAPVGTAPVSAQERGERALAALDFPWRSLGYRVQFLPHTGGGVAGHANSRTRTITVHVRPGHDGLSLRATIAHELGHALDFAHGTQERRDAYRRIRGLSPSLRWFSCDGCQDFSSPAGDWSEVFAASLVGGGDFRSRLGGPPTADQLRQLRSLFAVPAPAPAPAAAAPAEPEPEPEPEPEREPGRTGLLILGGGGLTA